MMVCNRRLSAVLIVLGLTTGLATACGGEPASVAAPPTTAVGQQPDGEAGPTVLGTLVVPMAASTTTPVPTVEGLEAEATSVASEPSGDPAPTAPTATPATPATELYSIQPGDTLLGLALARGIELAELQALNPDVRTEALQIGQQIVVPAISDSLPGVSLAAAAAATQAMDWTIVGDEVGLWVIGQVSNEGAEAVAPAQLTITLQTADGTELVRQAVWTAGRRIEAGGLAPFALYVPNMSAPDVAAQVSVEPPGLAPASETTVRAADVVVQRDGPAASVNGRVINEGENAVRDILLTVTYYDANGQYGGYRQLELPGEMAPGEDWPFRMAALPVRGTVDTVTVRVDARPAGE